MKNARGKVSQKRPRRPPTEYDRLQQAVREVNAATPTPKPSAQGLVGSNEDLDAAINTIADTITSTARNWHAPVERIAGMTAARCADFALDKNISRIAEIVRDQMTRTHFSADDILTEALRRCI